jgi:hypothetical protein
MSMMQFKLALLNATAVGFINNGIGAPAAG